MYQNKTFLGIVPARGGSKGIPHKNIAPLAGRELICYTLDAARRSRYLDGCVVSTDDAAIAAVAAREHAATLMRDPSLAQDDTRTIDVVLDAIRRMRRPYDYMVLLQPTSPLRTHGHIDDAIGQMIDYGQSSLVSMCRARTSPILIRRLSEDMRATSLLDTPSTVRRQDLAPYYEVNGAIYINAISELTANTSLNDNAYGYVMGEYASVDIDDPFDLAIAEMIIAQHTKKTNGGGVS